MKKNQTAQGEHQQETVKWELLDKLFVLPRVLWVLPIGTNSLSNLNQLCQEAGSALVQLLFTSLNIQNSLKDAGGGPNKVKMLEK